MSLLVTQLLSARRAERPPSCVQMGNLSMDLLSSAPSADFTAEQKKLGNVLRLLENVVSDVTRWGLTLTTPQKAHNMHSPDAEDDGLAKLAAALRDAPAIALLGGGAFPDHAAAKAAMSAAAEAFKAAIKEFEIKGIKMAQAEAKAYTAAYNRSLKAQAKVRSPTISHHLPSSPVTSHDLP